MVIVECATAKLFSALRVGPKAKLDIGFDLVCYRDCAEFYMERCLLSGPCEEGLQRRLKYCVAVMHAHRFVHRDVKPNNVVYSPSLGSYVLCDFGITAPIPSGPGTKTFAFSDGTMKYMSEELKELPPEGGLVDLYCADMHALKVTLGVMKHTIIPNKPTIPRESGPTPYIMIIKAISKSICVEFSNIAQDNNAQLEFSLSSIEAS